MTKSWIENNGRKGGNFVSVSEKRNSADHLHSPQGSEAPRYRKFGGMIFRLETIMPLRDINYKILEFKEDYYVRKVKLSSGPHVYALYVREKNKRRSQA